MTSADTPRYGVVGDPIAHSLSPVLHRAGYDALGIDARYDAVRVPAGGLAAHVAGLGPEWFDPLESITPSASPLVAGRQWDYLSG